jgi:hypothetical protein
MHYSRYNHAPPFSQGTARRKPSSTLRPGRPRPPPPSPASSRRHGRHRRRPRLRRCMQLLLGSVHGGESSASSASHHLADAGRTPLQARDAVLATGCTGRSTGASEDSWPDRHTRAPSRASPTSPKSPSVSSLSQSLTPSWPSRRRRFSWA